MRKIPTVLVRDPNDRAHVLSEVTPGCEWVLAGEGVPTRKYDGTCVMLDKGTWWARREVKPGKANPPGFQVSEVDDVTGRVVGWIPMPQSDWNRWFNEAYSADPRASATLTGGQVFEEGTYELCGPRINGNPDGFRQHILIRHADVTRITGWEPQGRVAALFELISSVTPPGWEGIVWHHPDGRMAKLKVRDVL